MPDAISRGEMTREITDAVISNLFGAGRLTPRPGDRTLIASAIMDVLYGNLPVDIPTWRSDNEHSSPDITYR